MGGEIEFLAGDGDGPPGAGNGPGDPGRHRSGAWRWELVVVAALVLVAGGAAALTVHRGDDPSSAPNRLPIATPVARTTVTLDSSTGRIVGETDPVASHPIATLSSAPVPVSPPAAPGDSDRAGVVAAAFAGADARSLVVLRPGRLTRLAVNGVVPLADRRIAAEIGDPTIGPWILVESGAGVLGSDGEAAGGGTLWAVGDGINLAFAFDAATLAPLREVLLDTGVRGAAALDGHVYVAARGGIYDLAPGAASARLIPNSLSADVLAADPSRHRLLLLEYDFGGGRATVEAFRPTRPGQPTTAAALPFSAGTLAVAGGAIWAIGSSPGSDGAAGTRDVLVRLNPATLRPITPESSPSVANGARLVAGGTNVVWVRPTSAAPQLWCVAAASGDVAQHWLDLAGTVVSRFGAAFVLSGETVTPLALNDRCTG